MIIRLTQNSCKTSPIEPIQSMPVPAHLIIVSMTCSPVFFLSFSQMLTVLDSFPCGSLKRYFNFLGDITHICNSGSSPHRTSFRVCSLWSLLSIDLLPLPSILDGVVATLQYCHYGWRKHASARTYNPIKSACVHVLKLKLMHGMIRQHQIVETDCDVVSKGLKGQ